MTIGSILLSISLFILVVGYLARPFFIQESKQDSRSKRLDLLLKKDQILKDIQALDFELDTSTISEPEYQQQRNTLMQEAALLLQEFELSLPQKGMGEDALDAKIEAAIANRRGIDISEAKESCPECDSPTIQGDKFCANCGHNLQEGAA